MLSLTNATPQPAGRALGATIFGATFLFRWLTLDFENDYFMHLAWAAEMLRGAWPVRDFVEPGFPLQTGLAYLGLRLGGYQLLWEGVMACAMIAGGATFTYLACVRLGVPRWLAVAATVIVVAAYPRLYAYPKAVAYPAAVWALALCTSRPATASLVVAGIVAGTAFLLRHDHGVYAAVATTVGLVLYHRTNWRGSLRALVVYGATAIMVAAPWLAWVQASGHADQYWRFLTGQSRGLATGQRAPDLTITIDRSQALIAFAPVDYPRVGVRWAPGTPVGQRRAREKQYALEHLEGDAYRLTNTTVENVGALVQDPVVEDTRGIDRGSLRVPDALFPWSYLQLQKYVPIVRLRVLPGAVNSSNALPWLAWVTFALPAVALVVAVPSFVRWSGPRPDTAAVVIAASILSAITYQTLVRASPDSRLGDVAGVTAILLAWISWRAWQVRAAPRLVTRVLALFVLALTMGAAMSFGRVTTRLSVGGIDGPTNIVRHIRAVGERYREHPLDVFAPPGATGLPHLARWLNTCTRDDARVAVLGFEPQVMVLAERGFAGGMAFYDLGWNSSESDQRLTVDRWTRQDVPVALAIESEWGSFSRDYPFIRAFIDREYRLAKQSAFDGAKEVRVFVKASTAPVRVDRGTALPCFR